MYFHNTIEDIVLKYLNDVLSEKNNICKCKQCFNDMACYVLNRIKPMYVVSSRGIIHTENKRREDRQDEIDVYTTISEAIEVVSGTRRHEVNSDYEVKTEKFDINPGEKLPNEYYYNFPQLVGRVFDSSNLAPIFDAEVILYDKMSENRIIMYNNQWTNPVELVPQMEGTFTFWPAPVPSTKSHIQKDFYMNISVIKKGYEPIIKFFYIRLVSSKELRNFITKEHIFYIDDIFINKGNRTGGRVF